MKKIIQALIAIIFLSYIIILGTYKGIQYPEPILKFVLWSFAYSIWIFMPLAAIFVIGKSNLQP